VASQLDALQELVFSPSPGSSIARGMIGDTETPASAQRYRLQIELAAAQQQRDEAVQRVGELEATIAEEVSKSECLSAEVESLEIALSESNRATEEANKARDAVGRMNVELSGKLDAAEEAARGALNAASERVAAVEGELAGVTAEKAATEAKLQTEWAELLERFVSPAPAVSCLLNILCVIPAIGVYSCKLDN
jgi:chromosome segregation ATPase